MHLSFRAAPFVTVRGICRMQVTELGEHVSLYVTPISLDPERPAMPISHPPYYAPYLAAKIGPFSTLGLAEDTTALNDGVVNDETFLTQTWDIDVERQRMFFAALDRLDLARWSVSSTRPIAYSTCSGAISIRTSGSPRRAARRQRHRGAVPAETTSSSAR